MTLIKTLFTFLLLSTSTTVYSLSLYVTKTNDTFDGSCDSDCSLREAIQLANETPGHDYIYLEQKIPTTYILERFPPYVGGMGWADEDLNEIGDLDILDDVTIKGAPRADITIINARNASRAFDNISGSSRLLHLTITRGSASGNGGGIINHANATLEMRNTHLHFNFSDAQGGGIANYGTLSIFSGLISDNHASGRSGELTEGGGVYNEGILTIRDSEFRGNKARGIGNSNMGGGMFNRGQADIRRVLFRNNVVHLNGWNIGNGVAVMNADGGTLKLVSSTVSGNDAPPKIEEVSAAVANGDPVYSTPGNMYLTNVTIARNRATGFFNAGETYIKNSIIVLNITPKLKSDNCYNYSGNLNTYGLLLSAYQSGYCSSDFFPVETAWALANLTSLIQVRTSSSRFSGPTHGLVLQANSAAIDAGGFDCPAYDQNTSSAPIDGDSDGVVECDLGALEYRPE